MEELKKYYVRRINKIFRLLETPKNNFTVETYHQLRVEIKKIKAIYSVLEHCDKHFNRKKNFKLFKLLFRQAGKIRELQIEEKMLNKYFQRKMLVSHHKNLTQKLSKEKKEFYIIPDRNFIFALRKTSLKTESFLDKLKREKAIRYLNELRKSLKTLLHKKRIKPDELHEIRKELKNYFFIEKFLNAKNKRKTKIKKDPLPNLLGKWNDCQVVLQHLKKLKKRASPGKIKEIKKVRAELLSNNKILLKKIMLTIPQSGLY